MVFLEHPITKYIVTHTPVTKNTLFENFKDAPDFGKEVELLEAHNSIYFDDNNSCCVDYRLLEMVYKGGDIVFEKIYINYIPQKNLQEYFVQRYPQLKNEFSEDELFAINLFSDGIKLSVKDKEYFENETPGLSLDFEKYEYTLFGRYFPDDEEQRNIELLSDLKVVILDDHELYVKQFIEWMKQRYFPESTWYSFTHPEDAITFLKESYTAKTDIHLIITDFNHPGINGCEFAKEVEQLEMKYKVPEASKVLISFQTKESDSVKQYEHLNLFCRIFSKADDPRLIGSFLRQEGLHIINSNSLNKSSSNGDLRSGAPLQSYKTNEFISAALSNFNVKVYVTFEIRWEMWMGGKQEKEVIEIPFQVKSIERENRTSYTFKTEDGDTRTLDNMCILSIIGTKKELWQFVVSESIIYSQYGAQLRRNTFDMFFIITHNFKRINRHLWVSEELFSHLNQL